MKLNVKRFAFMGLALIAVFILAACGLTTTTVAPTTTAAPTTVAPTTAAPTTAAPTTVAPTTVAPTTVAPTTVAPTTVAPTTVAPTTVAPTTVAPTTVAPTTTEPTTVVTTNPTELVQDFLDGLDLGDTTALTSDLVLPSSTVDGLTLVWTSTDADVISMMGEITVPRYGEGNGTAILRATANFEAVTLYRDFSITVLEETVVAYLTRIGSSILITNSDSITASFKLPGSYQTAMITWVSSNLEVATISATVGTDGLYTVTIVRPKMEDGGENTNVVLTATIALGEESVEVTKSIRVIAEPLATVYTSFEALHTTANLNDYVDVTGVVYEKFRVGYFMEDDLGKYIAVYTTEENATAVAIGDEVHVKGLYKSYNTLYQISNLTLQEVLTSDNVVQTTPIVLADATDLLDVDSSNKLIHGQTYRITVTPQILGTYNNLYLFQGEDRVATVYYESYDTSEQALKDAAGKLITIDVVYYTFYSGSSVLETGIYEVYVTYDGEEDGVYYVPLTGQAALDADYENLTLAETAFGGQSLTLPAAGGYDSVITWTIKSGTDYAEIVSGKLVIEDVLAAQTIVVEATLTLDELVPLTKEFSIAVSPITTSAIEDVWLMEKDDVAQVEGTVYFFINNGYFVFDGTGMLFIYTAAPAGTLLGDKLVVFGTVDIYNGQHQIKNVTVKSKTSTGNAYLQTPVVYEHGVSELISGQTYAITATVAIEGEYSNVYLYQGDTQIATIYYRSTINDSYNALKAFVDKEVTFNGVFYYTLSGLIYFVYQEGAAGIEPTDAQLAKDDVEGTAVKVSVVSNEVITLPTTATNGSTIAWALAETTYATLAGAEITYAEVTSAQTVTLTATFTYPVAGLDPIVTTKDYVVTISTYEEKLAEDIAAVTVALTATELDSVTLPAVGANGSVITWAVTSGNASIASGKVNYGYSGVAYDVVLTATVTLTKADLTTISGTKDITVAVSPVTLTSVADARAAALDTLFVIKGVVTATSGTSVYVQDATDAIYIYNISSSVFASQLLVGDEVVIAGKRAVFNSLVQVSTVTKVVVLQSGQDVPAPIELPELVLENLLNLQAKLVSLAGLTIEDIPTMGTSSFTVYLTNGTIDTQLRVDKYHPDFEAFKTYIATFAEGDRIDLVAIPLGRYNDNPQLMLTNVSQLIDHVATPAELAAADVDALTIKTAVVSDEVVVLPTTSGASTVTWALATTTFATLDVNTITYGEVTEAQQVTLTATLSYPVSGGDPIVTTKDFVVTISTYAAMMAEDVADLTLALTATEFDEVTLPALGTNGSVVTWAVTLGGANASIASGKVVYGYLGEAYSVTLTATLTLTKADLSTLVNTKEFVVAVSAAYIVEDLSLLSEKTLDAWTLPNNAYLLLQGVVTGPYATSGTFVQDASGVGIYIYGLKNQTVGDELIIYGKLAEYGSVRQISSAVVKETLSSGNAVVVTPMTLVQLQAVQPSFYEYAGMVVQVEAGVVIKEFRGDYMDLYWTLDGETQYLLSFKYNVVGFEWLNDVYAANDLLPAFQFTFYNIFEVTTFNITNLVVPMTEQQAVDVDALKLPALLSLSGDYDVPAPLYGSTYTVTAVSPELASYIDYTTTPGTLLVTQPLDADKTGTITISVSKGGATPVDVTINVTVTVAGAALTYVETFDAFPPTSSSYVDGTFTGVNSVLWTYDGARGDLNIGFGKAVCLNKLGSDALASVSATIQGGISSFSIQYKNAYSTDASVEVYINDVLIGTSVASGSVIRTYELTGLNVVGEFTLKIKTSNGQLIVDNLTWTTYSGE